MFSALNTSRTAQENATTKFTMNSWGEKKSETELFKIDLLSVFKDNWEYLD